jgi:hypothetical protein
MTCPSTIALAVALAPGVDADEMRFGQALMLAIGLSIAVVCRLVLM